MAREMRLRTMQQRTQEVAREGERRQMTIKTDKTRGQLILEGVIADLRHNSQLIARDGGAVLLERYIKRLESAAQHIDTENIDFK